jgi:ubiquinone/menaquinone biosynthesis C-methylase UbiE
LLRRRMQLRRRRPAYNSPMDERNPQADQMGDESMARNLAHQAEAIWPQERPLLDRYGLDGALEILDLGCGTGEISRRLADRYPQAGVLGIDILEGNLALARRASADYGERIRYETGDAFALGGADARFDLVACRHMSQSVPDFPLVVREIMRVLKPGGWLHLLSEDYGMLHFPVPSGGELDPDDLWHDFVFPFFRATNCDGRVGRHSYGLLRKAGYTDISVDYVIVDTQRVSRETFAGVLRAWGDGYSDVLAQASGGNVRDVARRFAAIVDSILDPDCYAAWHVPVISGRKPNL